MLRYINSVATIEQNLNINAIEINFKGYGVKNEYAVTLDMAIELAILQQASAYFLKKEHFKDIDVKPFYECIDHWLQRLDKHFNRGRGAKTKVALLVPADFFLELSSVIHKANSVLPVSLYHVSFEVFYATDKADFFLQREPVHAIHQREAVPSQKHKFALSNKL